MAAEPVLSPPHTAATIRCLSTRRPVLKVCETSASDWLLVARCPASRFWLSSRAFSLAADSTSRCRDLPGGIGSGDGGSSSTACAFVPPMPNPLTPALRGPDPGHGIASRLTKNGLFSSPVSGLGAVKYGLGGTTPFWTASAALTNPATPAAASRCPINALTDPSAQASGGLTNACVSAATSIGSPSGVAVPCAST